MLLTPVITMMSACAGRTEVAVMAAIVAAVKHTFENMLILIRTTSTVSRLESDPSDATKLLDAFIGRAWGLESGLSHKSEFDRSDFDSVAALIDPSIVLAALKTMFGTLLDNVDFNKCWELDGDRQTACRFVAIFNKVKEENATKHAATGTMHSTESASNAAPEESK